MVDPYSFSKENCMDSFPSFKHFYENKNNQDPFKIDNRDIQEIQSNIQTNPIEKTKKSKRNNSTSNSTKLISTTPTVQCDICSVSISGPIVYDSHIKGKKHQAQLKILLTKNPQYKAPTYEELCLLKKQESIVVNNENEKSEISVSDEIINEKQIAPPLIPTKKLNCNMCNISCNSQQMFDNHITGKKHQMKLKLSNLSNPAPPRVVPDNNPSSSNYCDVCSIQLNSENELTEHLAQRQHQTRVKEAEFCAKEGADMNINFDDYKITITDTEKDSFDYQCTLCKKKFRNKMQLIEHLKSALHIRLSNRSNNPSLSKQSDRVNNQTTRNCNINRRQNFSSFRGSNKSSGKSRSFRSQNFSRTQTFQSYDQNTNNIFGAFDPNNQSTFSFNNNNDNYYSSTKRSIPYENNSNEYDEFYSKRPRTYNDGNDNSQDFYSTDRNSYSSTTNSNYPWNNTNTNNTNNSYPSQINNYNNQSSTSQTSWQYPTEPHYDQQQQQQQYSSNPSSSYINTMHYPSNQPPLPNYEPPPLPSYPPPTTYTRPQNSTFLGTPGTNSFFPNSFGQ
ncbi:unnamed protein product [Rotaria sordida]|uniref:C2H2-type domain-containing protein n=1 Tax=Rotaria sordida TaxID=392033 RepID=A0A814WI31_9BILA|nr:unnamed protein product [Rotaria sordida]